MARREDRQRLYAVRQHRDHGMDTDAALDALVDVIVKLYAPLPSAVVAGSTWLWPKGENPASKRYSVPDQVRLLAPFDPVVWDRRRFELLWGWAYRFEAYTPAAKRLLGHYALPLLWRVQAIGWANLRVQDGVLMADVGFVNSAPSEHAFHLALNEELQRMAMFLGCGASNVAQC